MSAIWVCDGCGKHEQNPKNHDGRNWIKPHDWFQRSDKDGGPQDACSRECIELIAKKTGKTALVAPF